MNCLVPHLAGAYQTDMAFRASKAIDTYKRLCVLQDFHDEVFGGTSMATNESAENYLETILVLSKKLPVVRSVDIANELGFKKSSVSIAMKNLREKNHITVTDSGFIYLTDSGKEIAEMIFERHELLSSWLVSLGVPEDIAAEDACKIEHVISKESFQAVKEHVIFKKK